MQSIGRIGSQLQTGYVGIIPVRNIWLLMLYASDLFKQTGSARISLDANPDEIPDLVAKILTTIVERRLKRNLYSLYKEKHSDLNRVKGRIDHLRTSRQHLSEQGKVACKYDELSVDRPRNRYVRSALEIMNNMVKCSQLKAKCRSLVATFKQIGVVGAKPTLSEMSVDRLARHDYEDRQMVAAADLAYNIALPTEIAGEKSMLMPERNLDWLRKLYEKAVAGFYDVVLPPKDGWKVYPGKTYDWQIDDETEGIKNILPNMITDIVIDNYNKEHRIIVDTKFNSILAKGWYREETIRSAYLYQIYAYLRSQECVGDPLTLNSTGILLHPSVGRAVDESVEIQGHKISFCTVDLGENAEEIRCQLLKVIGADYLINKIGGTVMCL